jgi:hypothetical protein
MSRLTSDKNLGGEGKKTNTKLEHSGKECLTQERDVWLR